MARNSKARAVIFLIVLATGALILLTGSVAIYVVAGPVLPRSQLDQLTAGMSKEEVQAVLGLPNKEMGDRQWTYSRWPNPGWVEIHFDEHGKLTLVNDESP